MNNTSAFESGIARLGIAIEQMNLAVGFLNDSLPEGFKETEPLSLKEWHSLFKIHQRLHKTHQRLARRVKKGVK